MKYDQTVQQVMEILNREKILSVPVLNEKDELLGFVDVLDIAGFILNQWEAHHFQMNSTSLTSKEAMREEFFSQQVNKVIFPMSTIRFSFEPGIQSNN